MEDSHGMRRRFFLGGSLSVGALSVSGCIALNFDSEGRRGVNKELELRNNWTEAVTLHISIEKGRAPAEQREVVFDDAVEIPANQTITRDVLGDDQYYLSVEMGQSSHQFGTRPICDRAFTRIIVTEDGKLTSEIQDCE